MTVKQYRKTLSVLLLSLALLGATGCEQADPCEAGHTFVEDAPAVEASCTAEGMTARRHCSVCGHAEGGEVLPVTEHRFADAFTVEKNATLSGSGRISVRCMDCAMIEEMKTDRLGEVLRQNALLTEGADPGVIYVSKEDDPENGGYFYAFVTSYKFECYRSTDLQSWSPCGQALQFGSSDWIEGYCWAPEVMRDPDTGTYYLYFSAKSKVGYGTTSTANEYNRMHIGVAKSDKPQGPYTLCSEPFDFDENVPAIREANGGADFWPTIDASPFRDKDGTLYLYLVHHSSTGSKGNSIWVVKMKDYVTPDYATLTMLTMPGYNRVDQNVYINDGITNFALKPYNFEKYAYDGSSKIDEAPNVVERDGLYYLTYSPFGTGWRRYSVMQAVSDSPMGPFTKLEPGVANPVIGICDEDETPGNPSQYDDISSTIDYAQGPGHHCFVEAGDELYSVYHVSDPAKTTTRYLGADKVEFVYNPAAYYYNSRGEKVTGIYVLCGNGPTDTLQPIPAVTSGYRNIVAEATITVDGEVNETTKYLQDGIFVMHSGYRDMECRLTGDSVITLSFAAPRTARALMLYTAYDYAKALRQIESVTLYAADGTTQVLRAGEDTMTVDKRYVAEGKMHYGSSIVVSLPEQDVVKLEIKVSPAGKFVTTDAEICISDLVVLGK